MRVMKSMAKYGVIAAAAALGFGGFAQDAAALPDLACTASCVITSGNSAANIEPGSQAGMNSWVVDGTNQLAQQWFWYRVGGTAGNPDHSIDTLPLNGGFLRDLDNNGSYENYIAQWQGNGFSITISYNMNGGSANSHNSDIRENITIHNDTAGALNFHFFQYSDFDLNGSVADCGIVMPNGQTVRQTDGSGPLTLSETTVTLPSRWELGLFPNTLNSLNGGPNGYDLSNSPAIGTPLGPGDDTWAFQWDANIGAGGDLIITKDKNLTTVVPEPIGLGILGLGMLAFGVARRRKSA
jgi:hypothetical protein